MEVVKDNRIAPDEWSDEVTCEGCASTLTLKLSDLCFMPATGTFWEGTDSYEYFRCPVCGSREYYGKSIPDYLRSAMSYPHHDAVIRVLLMGGILTGLGVLLYFLCT